MQERACIHWLIEYSWDNVLLNELRITIAIRVQKKCNLWPTTGSLTDEQNGDSK